MSISKPNHSKKDNSQEDSSQEAHLEQAKLHKKLQQQAARIKKAELERPTLLSQTVYISTLGLLLILPVIAGAYLGAWLDEQLKGYSIGWTMSLILLGVFVGGLNVYLFIREKDD